VCWGVSGVSGVSYMAVFVDTCQVSDLGRGVASTYLHRSTLIHVMELKAEMIHVVQTFAWQWGSI
jgi:hypothetical protein